MHGVVVAPGIDPTPVEHRCLAPTKRWPYPGQRLPVTVDRGDPTRLQIVWDEVPTRRSVAAESAETLATSMRTPEMKSAQETVLAAPGRPVPGQAGGGLTPEQAAAAASAPGLQTVGNDLPVFVDPHARDRIAVDGASMGL